MRSTPALPLINTLHLLWPKPYLRDESRQPVSNAGHPSRRYISIAPSRNLKGTHAKNRQRRRVKGIYRTERRHLCRRKGSSPISHLLLHQIPLISFYSISPISNISLLSLSFTHSLLLSLYRRTKKNITCIICISILTLMLDRDHQQGPALGQDPYWCL